LIDKIACILSGVSLLRLPTINNIQCTELIDNVTCILSGIS
jgi:hypothetical protein